jgi:hypothetical protein
LSPEKEKNYKDENQPKKNKKQMKQGERGGAAGMREEGTFRMNKDGI